MEETTDILRIPVPSTDGVFLAFIVVHIFISLLCVISGLLAMLSEKGSILSAFTTVIILTIMRWPHNIHLLSIGIIATLCSSLGYRLAKIRKESWTRLHTVLMGLSYVFLLTGFYVDNGKNLPFWKLFPQWFFWVIPAAVGIPIILKVLKTHPLNRIGSK